MLRRHIEVVVGASRVELEIGWRARAPLAAARRASRSSASGRRHDKFLVPKCRSGALRQRTGDRGDEQHVGDGGGDLVGDAERQGCQGAVIVEAGSTRLLR